LKSRRSKQRRQTSKARDFSSSVKGDLGETRSVAHEVKAGAIAETETMSVEVVGEVETISEAEAVTIKGSIMGVMLGSDIKDEARRESDISTKVCSSSGILLQSRTTREEKAALTAESPEEREAIPATMIEVVVVEVV